MHFTFLILSGFRGGHKQRELPPGKTISAEQHIYLLSSFASLPKEQGVPNPDKVLAEEKETYTLKLIPSVITTEYKGMYFHNKFVQDRWKWRPA